MYSSGPGHCRIGLSEFGAPLGIGPYLMPQPVDQFANGSAVIALKSILMSPRDMSMHNIGSLILASFWNTIHIFEVGKGLICLWSSSCILLDWYQEDLCHIPADVVLAKWGLQLSINPLPCSLAIERSGFENTYLFLHLTFEMLASVAARWYVSTWWVSKGVLFQKKW